MLKLLIILTGHTKDNLITRMITINNYNDFQQQAIDAVTHWQAADARALLLKIDSAKLENLKVADLELYAKYKKLQILLKHTAVPILPDDEVLDLIKNSILEGFGKEMDLSERLGLKLLVIPELIRDDFKDRVSKTMLANEQRLGNKSVKSWLLDYNRNSGARKHNTVERTEYMMKNKEVQMLNEQDKTLLRKVLTLYDEMKVEMVRNQMTN